MSSEFCQAIRYFIHESKSTKFNNMASNASSATTTLISGSESQVDDIYSLQAKITSQQSLVKQLKKDSAASADIQKEVDTLLQLRAQVAELEKQNQSNTPIFNRKGFDELILRKMYVVPSFEIHNGPAGNFFINITLLIYIRSHNQLNSI